MRKQMFNLNNPKTRGEMESRVNVRKNAHSSRGRGILNLIILDAYLAGLTLPVIIVALIAEVLR